jgi:Fe(3+) dicitrate transport protein
MLLAFVFLNAGNMLAGDTEQATITGFVYDKESGEPLIGAHVMVEVDGAVVNGAVSNLDGRYVLDRLEPGTKTLRVSYLGYAQFRELVQVKAGVTLKLNALLELSAIQMAAVEIIGESPRVYKRMPGTATRLNRREIELIRPIGTQELLEYVPGVNGFADDGIGNSRISIGIRGLNPRRSSRVLVLEDGVPIQPAMYVYANMYYNPPAERIDAVEVIKGSAAIKHGPQTMGGVINYITRRPAQNFAWVNQVTTGTNGFASILSELQGLGSEKARFDVQALIKHGDGFRENNTFDQQNATVKINLMPSASKVIFIKANFNREVSNATYTGLTEYSFRTNPTFNPKNDDLFTVVRGSLDIHYSNQVTSSVLAQSTFYSSYFTRDWWRENDIFVRASDYRNGPANAVPYYTPGDLIRVGNGRDNFGILRSFATIGYEHEYEIKHSLGAMASTLEMGARVHWERFADDRKVGSSPMDRTGVYFYGDPDSSNVDIVGQSHRYETTALAFYIAEKVQFGALSLTPGLRFELFEQERIDRLQGSIYLDKTNFVILPGIGFNAEFDRINIFGGIHRGYTPPSSGTLKITNFGLQPSGAGLDLKSEKSWNSELGVRFRSDWLAAELSGFHLAIEDLVAAGRGAAFQNLGRVWNSGLETGATIKMAKTRPWLPNLHFSYTLLHTEIKSGLLRSAAIGGNSVISVSGNKLPYAPTHTLAIGLEKSLETGLSIRADYRYVSTAYADFENIETTYNRGDTGPIPGYSIVNASLSYQLNPRMRIFVVGKNLFDRIYIGSRLHSSPAQPQAHLSSGIIPGPRRQLNFGMQISM